MIATGTSVLLCDHLPGGIVVCQACAHGCRLADGQRGRCRVRANRGGALVHLAEGVIAAQSLDPIEKKPLRRYRPGSTVYTVGTPSCNLHCTFCRNWELSHTSKGAWGRFPTAGPEEIVNAALQLGADGIAFSYTEPAIIIEFAVDTMRLARAEGLFSVWHTNGYLSKRACTLVSGWLAAACIDLKMPDDARMQRYTGGSLVPVLKTAQALQQQGVWVEIATPLLPGINDCQDDIFRMAQQVLSWLGAKTPWHLLPGVPAGEMRRLPIQSFSESMQRVCWAQQAGLQDTWLAYG